MMAADRQITYHGKTILTIKTKLYEIEPHNAKMLFGHHKAFIGFAGTTLGVGSALLWLSDLTRKVPRLRDLEMVVLTGKKEIYHAMQLDDWIQIKDKQFAIGSGGSHAMAAMLAGCNPYKAVAIASKLDAFTGQGITKLEM